MKKYEYTDRTVGVIGLATFGILMILNCWRFISGSNALKDFLLLTLVLAVLSVLALWLASQKIEADEIGIRKYNLFIKVCDIKWDELKNCCVFVKEGVNSGGIYYVTLLYTKGEVKFNKLGNVSPLFLILNYFKVIQVPFDKLLGDKNNEWYRLTEEKAECEIIWDYRSLYLHENGALPQTKKRISFKRNKK